MANILFPSSRALRSRRGDQGHHVQGGWSERSPASPGAASEPGDWPPIPRKKDRCLRFDQATPWFGRRRQPSFALWSNATMEGSSHEEQQERTDVFDQTVYSASGKNGRARHWWSLLQVVPCCMQILNCAHMHSPPKMCWDPRPKRVIKVRKDVDHHGERFQNTKFP